MTRAQIVVPRSRLTDGAVAAALSDELSRRLLSLCIQGPKGIRALSQEMGRPLASIYRHANQLVRAGLLVSERSAFTEDGKRYELYRSRICAADLRLDARGVAVTWKPVDEVEARLVRLAVALAPN